MQDAWLMQIAALSGTWVAPAARVPAAQRRTLIDGKPGRAGRSERSAGAPAMLPRHPTDRDILGCVARTGSITGPQLADAMRTDADTARERLRTLSARGLLRRRGNAWIAASPEV